MFAAVSVQIPRTMFLKEPRFSKHGLDLKAMVKPLQQAMDDGASRIAIGLILVQHRPA